jgi:hypothetical protein
VDSVSPHPKKIKKKLHWNYLELLRRNNKVQIFTTMHIFTITLLIATTTTEVDEEVL